MLVYTVYVWIRNMFEAWVGSLAQFASSFVRAGNMHENHQAKHVHKVHKGHKSKKGIEDDFL